MSTTQRWVVSHVYSWPSVLPFFKRRSALLDWWDTNVDVVQVMDGGPDYLGIAVGDAAARLTLRRDGMELTAHRPDAEVEMLSVAVAGVLEVVAPREAKHEGTVSGWSVPLPFDLAAGCARAARRAVGELGSEFDPVDAALLVDITTPTSAMQVEYGFVDRDQLIDRLTHRVTPRGQALGPKLMMPTGAPVPDTAIYTHLYWRPVEPAPILDVTHVYESNHSADRASQALVEQLAASFAAAREIS